MSQEITPELLSLKQQTDFDDAHELAIQADTAFDIRRFAAKALARAQYISDELQTDITKEVFHQADQDFDLYNAAAATLMPSRGVFETNKLTTAESVPFANDTVWNAMSPEQRKLTPKFVEAILVKGR